MNVTRRPTPLSLYSVTGHVIICVVNNAAKLSGSDWGLSKLTTGKVHLHPGGLTRDNSQFGFTKRLHPANTLGVLNSSNTK